MVFVGLLSSLTRVHCRAFSLAVFYLAIIVSVLSFSSVFHQAPLILNGSLWGGGVG